MARARELERLLLPLLTFLAGAPSTGCLSPGREARWAAAAPAPAEGARRPFAVRMRAEQLRNPYWYAEHGQAAEAEQFWDRSYWERVLGTISAEGYNAVLFMPEPWQEDAWQTFLIRHREFPEARDHPLERYDRVIAQVGWIFRRAHELGLKTFLWSYFIVTTRSFARAHGMEGEMQVSASVDFRHNLRDQMGPHFGVRNELTRAFTEAAIAELFQTYSHLDGLCGGMGEALPGKRSTWYREAVVPGLRRSGRDPIFIVDDWMLPLDDFLEDIVRPAVYEHTWLSVKANGEMLTDSGPYPEAIRWAAEAGVPTLLQVMNLNLEAGLPFDSPRMAHEILEEFGRVPHCVGYVAWFLDSNPNTLFRGALGHYGKTAGRYSGEPWIDALERRYGDRRAAEHLLAALDAAARIPMEVAAIAWLPQDIGHSQQLVLPYWHWSLEDPRWGHFASPSRGSGVLPLRHYARVVAKLGGGFRDQSGADWARNAEHPGAQELIWGLTRYPTTPEAQMRRVRGLGEECAREAREGAALVKRNAEGAARLRDSLEAYRLLTRYYEKKVLAAVSALIHGFGGGKEHRVEAERLADEAVSLYGEAVEFIRDRVDRNTGTIQVRWGGKSFSLSEIIDIEKQERERLAAIFQWPRE